MVEGASWFSACLAASGCGHFAVIEETMDSKVDQEKETLRTSFHDMKLQRCWVMQQDTSKSLSTQVNQFKNG